MAIANRRSWFVLGVVPALLVVAALIFFQAGSRVQAAIVEVDVESTVVPVGESVTITVQTLSGTHVLQASIDANGGGGQAVFGDTGTTIDTETTGAGYAGVATFVVEALEPGVVEIQIVHPETGVTETVMLTIVPPGATGLLTPPVGPEIGVHITRWSGGTIDALIQAAPANALSFWATVDGELVGYIKGAPDFVNARFMAAFPGGEIPAQTPMIVVVR